MDAYYQSPVQNYQWYNKARSYRKRKYRSPTPPVASRAMLMIDGAYFEQGSFKYFTEKQEFDFNTSAYPNQTFTGNLFDTNNPEILISSFINSIEEMMNVSGTNRYFYTALFDESQGNAEIVQKQKSMIEILEEKGGFTIDLREFKNMSVYGPNKGCKHSHFPINRKVQAEVDVAIATKALSMAAKDKYDVLVIVTGDRDFKDGFTSIVNEFNKYVTIIGFSNSTWSDYYDKFDGIEVIGAEQVWEKAILKSLFVKHRTEDSKYGIRNKSPIPVQTQKLKYGYNNYRGRSQYSVPRNESTNKISIKSKPFKSKRHHTSKAAPLPKTKNQKVVTLSSGKYFDQINLELKFDLISKYNADEYTAEVALFVTKNDKVKAEQFLSS